MALVALDGSPLVPVGWNILDSQAGTASTLDATNESVVMVGHVITSDGGSHTIDTTGSSSLQWRANAVTFANGGSTVKVGLAAVDTGNGPPVRASNASDVISFDVAAVFTGGGGGITTTAWNTSVPTTGTKTIANGDLVAFGIQMTARGGADSVVVLNTTTVAAFQRPAVTAFTSSYSAATAVPNCIIVFSDGAIGYFAGSIVWSATTNNRTYNNGSSPNEYGQLFDLPFPVKVYGIYAIIDPDGDCDFVLYSDPLGTPVPEKTVSLDLNTGATANFQRVCMLFSSPYAAKPRQKMAAVLKPSSGTSMSARYKTLANAAHRITEHYGTAGYGVSRSSGAFASENSNLDMYYIGLLCGAFEHPARASYQMGF